MTAQPDAPLVRKRVGNWRRLPRQDLRRLTPRQVARIRAPDADMPALADEFKISRVAAWKVKKRMTYRDLP